MSTSGQQIPASALLTRLGSRRSFPLGQETALFALASALDVVLTYQLLCHPEISFQEMNPLARYFIYGWGLKGMIFFKFMLVALVAGVCQVIARTRPDVGRRVLNYAAVVVSAVVVYSSLLLWQGSRWA